MDWLDWNEPSPERSPTIDRFRDVLVTCKWGLIGAPIAALFSLGLFLLLTTPQYRGEAQILVDGPTNPANVENNAEFAARGAERLVASRDLARRAIKELGIEARPEFDPVAHGGVGLISRALILTGLMRDPVRMSADERILKSYEDRLTVNASPATGLIRIAFRSDDRDLAANAANRIADLYLEMRSDAESGIVVARATPPRRPAPPNRTLLLALCGGVAAITMLGALVFRAMRRPVVRLRAPIEEPEAPPRALGQADVFVRLKETARLGPQVRRSANLNRAEAENAQALAEVARRVLSARRPGGGVRIVGARLADALAAPNVMLALGRLLAREGRSIVVSLDAANAEALPECGAPGLSDLVSGTASFDEVIRRDPESRLHFAPLGDAGPIDIGELGRILDALARTYDFIWLLAPPLDADDMAKILAGAADFVVLAAPPNPPEGAIRKAEAELLECGAGEILVIGAPIRVHARLGQDAA